MSAFLRGVERRAAVFAHLQAGNPETGLAALADAMAAFRAAAARTAFGDWPRRFWSLLLAVPVLREAGPGTWPVGFEPLGRVGRGPRAALLLRLVAHVSEADAAAVLGVSRPTYRMALRRALPREAGGGADPIAWRMLAEAAQHAIRDMPPERLAELARAREAALEGTGWKPAPPAEAPPRRPASPASRRPRWLWPALAAVVVATVAALVATTRLDERVAGPDAGPQRIRSEALSTPPPPATALDGDLALLTHPDFELLVAGARGVGNRDPGLLAWLVHRLEVSGEAAGAASPAARPPPPSAPSPAPGRVLPPALQELAASLPPPARAQMVLRHARLRAMTPEELAALRAQVVRWKALERNEQVQRRDAWQSWNRLPAAARARMRAAQAAFTALPEERRQTLEEEFAGLDALERSGWRLGPDVGADWPTLHPLFALVPSGQQEALLAVLMSMDAQQRTDLGILAQRTPPGERDALRSDLLTTPAENRAAWLRQRIGR